LLLRPATVAIVAIVAISVATAVALPRSAPARGGAQRALPAVVAPRLRANVVLLRLSLPVVLVAFLDAVVVRPAQGPGLALSRRDWVRHADAIATVTYALLVAVAGNVVVAIVVVLTARTRRRAERALPAVVATRLRAVLELVRAPVQAVVVVACLDTEVIDVSAIGRVRSPHSIIPRPARSLPIAVIGGVSRHARARLASLCAVAVNPVVTPSIVGAHTYVLGFIATLVSEAWLRAGDTIKIIPAELLAITEQTVVAVRVHGTRTRTIAVVAQLRVLAWIARAFTLIVNARLHAVAKIVIIRALTRPPPTRGLTVTVATHVVAAAVVVVGALGAAGHTVTVATHVPPVALVVVLALVPASTVLALPVAALFATPALTVVLAGGADTEAFTIATFGFGRTREQPAIGLIPIATTLCALPVAAFAPSAITVVFTTARVRTRTILAAHFTSITIVVVFTPGSVIAELAQPMPNAFTSGMRFALVLAGSRADSGVVGLFTMAFSVTVAHLFGIFIGTLCLLEIINPCRALLFEVEQRVHNDLLREAEPASRIELRRKPFVSGVDPPSAPVPVVQIELPRDRLREVACKRVHVVTSTEDPLQEVHIGVCVEHGAIGVDQVLSVQLNDGVLGAVASDRQPALHVPPEDTSFWEQVSGCCRRRKERANLE